MNFIRPVGQCVPIRIGASPSTVSSGQAFMLDVESGNTDGNCTLTVTYQTIFADGTAGSPTVGDALRSPISTIDTVDGFGSQTMQTENNTNHPIRVTIRVTGNGVQLSTFVTVNPVQQLPLGSPDPDGEIVQPTAAEAPRNYVEPGDEVAIQVRTTARSPKSIGRFRLSYFAVYTDIEGGVADPGEALASLPTSFVGKGKKPLLKLPTRNEARRPIRVRVRVQGVHASCRAAFTVLPARYPKREMKGPRSECTQIRIDGPKTAPNDCALTLVGSVQNPPAGGCGIAVMYAAAAASSGAPKTTIDPDDVLRHRIDWCASNGKIELPIRVFNLTGKKVALTITLKCPVGGSTSTTVKVDK